MAYAAGKDLRPQALPDLDKIIEADANNAMAFATRGRVHLAKNDGERALTDFSRAIDRCAIPGRALSRPRHDLQEQGDTARALGDLDAAIKIDPKPADIYFERAIDAQSQGATHAAPSPTSTRASPASRTTWSARERAAEAGQERPPRRCRADLVLAREQEEHRLPARPRQAQMR